MPIVFADDGSGEDEAVEDDAETVENAERGNQADKGTFEVQFCFENHYQGHNIA